MSPVLVVLFILISILVLIFLTIKVKLHPFFALTISAIVFGLLIGQNINDIMDAYASGLGSTISGIGVVIAIGTVMGALLEKSGAAETMAKTILKITGEKHAALALPSPATLSPSLFSVIPHMFCSPLWQSVWPEIPVSA